MKCIWIAILSFSLGTCPAWAQAAVNDKAGQDAKAPESQSDTKSEAKPEQAKPEEVKSAEAKPEEAKAQEAKPEEAKAAEAKPEGGAAKAGEEEAPTSYSFETGYRFINGIGGNRDTYRSIVDFGEGPRVFGLEFHTKAEAGPVYDRMDATAAGWGGEPNSFARVDLEKHGLYKVTLQQRSNAYFASLPSFGNPNVTAGGLMSQRAYDIRRDLTELTVELRPGKRIVPLFTYMRDRGNGSGVTPFFTDVNEFASGTFLQDRTHHFVGGVHVELGRWHLSLDQGGTLYADRATVADSLRNGGNRQTNFLGQTIFATNLNQLYRTTAESFDSRGFLSGQPFNWLDVQASFTYSLPTSDVQYTQDNTGLFATLPAGFVAQQRLITFSTSKLPHSSAGFGFELRPMSRLRVIHSMQIDRMHNSASRLVEQQLGVREELFVPDFFATNFNQHRLDLVLDAGKGFTLRAGHRYLWGDSTVRASFIAPEEFLDYELKRNVATVGVGYRQKNGLRVNADYEKSFGDRTYFRTSLQDYSRFTTRARYQLAQTFQVSAQISNFRNQNRVTALDLFRAQSDEGEIAVTWMPRGSLSLTGSYARSQIYTTIPILIPTSLARQDVDYEENADLYTMLADIRFGGRRAPFVQVGGSYLRNQGSRPVDFARPMFRTVMPVSKNVSLVGEWRYWGFGQALYRFEGFRTHQITAGLKIER
jgi:hypothetical protein